MLNSPPSPQPEPYAVTFLKQKQRSDPRQPGRKIRHRLPRQAFPFYPDADSDFGQLST